MVKWSSLTRMLSGDVTACVEHDILCPRFFVVFFLSFFCQLACETTSDHFGAEV